MRKKIVMIQRCENGVAILDTPKKRILFVLMVILSIVFAIISYVTPLWLIYWVFTGRSLFKIIFSVDEI
jgi:hypothetical protein